MRLAARFSASVVGVLVLAMVTSRVAALLATRIAGLMGRTAHDYLPSIRAAGISPRAKGPNGIA